MSKRRRSADDIPLDWRGGRHAPYSDPTVTSVSLNRVGPGAFGGDAPKKRRRAGPSAFTDGPPATGPQVELEPIEPARPAPPRASGRIKLRK